MHRIDTGDLDRRVVGDVLRHQAETVGEGQEYRTEVAGHQGSALCCGEAPVHVSVLAGR